MMGIYFDEKNQIFWLNTPRSTYAIGMMEEEKLLGHLYYGAKIASDDVRFLNRVGDTLFSPAARPSDRLKFNDAFPMEYPTAGVGDFRAPCLSVRTAAGHTACSLAYRSHRIIPGKPGLPGLPAVFGSKNDCTTLEILCEDEVLNLHVTLRYTALYELDITKLNEEEKRAIPDQIKLFHRCEPLMREGDYYRLTSVRENRCHDAVMLVSKDKSRALVIFIQAAAQPMGTRSWKLHLRGLDPGRAYRINGGETVLHGSTLMNAGLLIGKLWGDYQGCIFELESV